MGIESGASAAAAGRRISSCFLCGSDRLRWSRYIDARSLGPLRALAYALPERLANGLASLSRTFAKAFRSVETNRRYFDTDLCFCEACGTASVTPPFDEARLARYYEEFYWDNRDIADGQHLIEDARPNHRQNALTADRIAWFDPHIPALASLIDFGAGDCSASYMLRDRAKAIAVDPSVKTQAIARQLGLEWRRTLVECPEVDLLYASHSLEHVHDLKAVFGAMLGRVRPGGHIFIEVPHIATHEVLCNLVHTPHTYMLSKGSFEQLARQFDCRIIAMEDVGSPWRVKGREIASGHNADLRVLIQRGESAVRLDERSDVLHGIERD